MAEMEKSQDGRTENYVPELLGELEKACGQIRYSMGVVTMQPKAFLRMFRDFKIQPSGIENVPIELTATYSGVVFRAAVKELRTIDIRGIADA